LITVRQVQSMMAVPTMTMSCAADGIELTGRTDRLHLRLGSLSQQFSPGEAASSALERYR
jgi:hypothetical protein